MIMKVFAEVYSFGGKCKSALFSDFITCIPGFEFNTLPLYSPAVVCMDPQGVTH